MKKIEIGRAFSKKIQLNRYEPIEFFCSAKAEVELEPREFQAQRGAISSDLDGFVQSEVEKSAAKFKKIDHEKSKDVGEETAALDSNSDNSPTDIN